MRVIVVGAQGEVGRSVLQGVASHKEVTDVIALFDDGTTPEAPIPDVDGTPFSGARGPAPAIFATSSGSPMRSSTWDGRIPEHSVALRRGASKTFCLTSATVSAS